MIRKKSFVETVCARLAGGDTPADTRGVFHPLTVETETGIIYADLINDDPNIAADMAIPATATISETQPYTGELSTIPMGSNGVFSIKAGVSDSFNIVDQQAFDQLRSANPNGRIAKIYGSTITLSHKPAQSEIEALVLPDFRLLAQDAYVILERNELKMQDMVVERLMQRGAQEKMNDSRRDQPMQANVRR